jgi:DNA-binding phage protein
MGSQIPARIGALDPATSADDDVIELAGYCGRPSCRQQFPQTVGPGRRREYCSETCRRGADRDYKKAKAMVAHFTDLLERSRYDVATFGRDNEESTGVLTPEAEAAMVTKAYGAIQRVEGMLEIAEDHGDRWLRELRTLVTAVSPLLGSIARESTRS